MWLQTLFSPTLVPHPIPIALPQRPYLYYSTEFPKSSRSIPLVTLCGVAMSSIRAERSLTHPTEGSLDVQTRENREENSMEAGRNYIRHSSSKSLPAHTSGPVAERVSGSSAIDDDSFYYEPAISSTALQNQLYSQLESVANQSYDSASTQPATPEGSGQTGAEDLDGRPPTFQWYARDDPLLDAHLYASTRQKTLHHCQIPLKPCLKTKAKSTTTSPPGLSRVATNASSENRTLRRSKTVEFEVATKSLLALQRAAAQADGVKHDLKDRAGRQYDQIHLRKNSTSQKSLYPNLLGTAKSQLAGPATTHTDVHVIAITPSKSDDEKPEQVNQRSKADPVTPTMQVVESRSGYYEVIWDDVPPENSVNTTRRQSSATVSLSAASSTATEGLQRVNSKLTDWSGSWNSPSNTFKPTIVVFPDDNGKTNPFGKSIDDDDSEVTVPPNSQRTSATHSRPSSRPASAPLTRASSQEQLNANPSARTGNIEPKQDWVAPLETTLEVPKTDRRSTYKLNSNRRSRQAPTYRKLSNIEEADLKFRGHRDSVTLAHTRLMHSGGVSPELFAHRDSISMAKKRMHARNHAVSDAIPNSTFKHRDTPQLLVTSLDDSILPSMAANELAVSFLGSQKPRSILGTRSSESLRHVRIS